MQELWEVNISSPIPIDAQYRFKLTLARLFRHFILNRFSRVLQQKFASLETIVKIRLESKINLSTIVTMAVSQTVFSNQTLCLKLKS